MPYKCLILVTVVLAALPSRADEPTPAGARPDDAWDAVFQRTSGWTGGDVAGSIDLRDGRTLWVFGDSWVGKVRNGKHAPGSRMVNNAIAVHPDPPLGTGNPPDVDSIRFFWGPDDDKRQPTAWVVPDPPEPNRWYWTSGGGCVVPTKEGTPRLVVFLFHLERRQGRQDAWSFRHVGSAVAFVDNLRAPVDQWKVEQLKIPDKFGEDEANTGKRRFRTSWGVTAYLDASSPAKETDMLYIYGVRDVPPWNKQLLLARVPAQSVLDMSAWRYCAGPEEWSPRAADAVVLANGVAPELSVERLVRGKRNTFVMVHSELFFGRRIFVRTAPRPEGPWTQAKPVYTVPDLDRNRSYFTYAAKGHLALSRKGELLVTYVINAQDLWTMAADASIYRPRFIRVPLSMVRPDGDAP